MGIDLHATKKNVIEKFGTIQAYADSRPFKYVTLQRFFKRGIGPIGAVRPSSKSQTIAAFLRADGLLIESAE